MTVPRIRLVSNLGGDVLEFVDLAVAALGEQTRIGTFGQPQNSLNLIAGTTAAKFNTADSSSNSPWGRFRVSRG